MSHSSCSSSDSCASPCNSLFGAGVEGTGAGVEGAPLAIAFEDGSTESQTKILLCPINIRSNKKQPKIKNRVSTAGVARTLQKLMDLSMQEIRVLLRPRLPSVFCYASLAAGRP